MRGEIGKQKMVGVRKKKRQSAKERHREVDKLRRKHIKTKTKKQSEKERRREDGKLERKQR